MRDKVLPVHPFLVVIFPIISLLGHNIAEITPAEAFRSLLVSLAAATLLLLIARLSFMRWQQAALAVTLVTALFFSYGHVYGLLKSVTLAGIPVGRHRFLIPIWLGILITGWWGVKKLHDTASITRTLNLFGVFLLVYPVFQIASHQVKFLDFRDYSTRNVAGAQIQPAGEQARPDIYYVILDAYTRDDTLLDFYEYDNRPFIQALEKRGFFVARCSQSNYPRTFLSLSSSLNFSFVQELTSSNSGIELTVLIKDNAVRRKLEDLGYTTIAIDGGYFRTRWEDADVYFAYRGSGERIKGLNEFETILIDTTAGLLLLDTNTALGGQLFEIVTASVRQERYKRVNFILDTLDTLATYPGPKFVFSHIPVPHEPYIFNADGDFLPAQEAYIPGYRDQVAYLNERVLTLVDHILERSDSPPIIILQGDHGGGETKLDFRRLHILNAYYFPGKGSEFLYPSITPVNTFRLVFDAYFGDNLGLLPDISYFSTPPENFSFTVAPNTRPGCGN